MAFSLLSDKPAIRERALPLSVEAYHFLGTTGTLPENVELLKGIILKDMPKSPRHSFYTEEIASILRECTEEGWFVRQEQPLTLSDSEPKPDIALVIGWRIDWLDVHPVTADLVIEIATPNSEIEVLKADVYASNVMEYWIVIPETKSVEVYTDPSNGVYATRVSHIAPQIVASKQAPKFRLDLAELFSHGSV